MEKNLPHAIRRQLEALPLTSEQWETNHSPIVRENLARLTVMMENARKHLPDVRTALDIGVGYGYTTAAIRAAYPGVAMLAGIEHPSRTLLQDATWRALCDLLDVDAVGGDAYHLPFSDASFDLAVCGEILEHLAPTRVMSFLREVGRVTRTGGVVVITTPNLLSLTNRGMMAVGRSPFELPVPSAGQTYGHIREYSRADVSALLVEAGFAAIEVQVVSRSRGGENAPSYVRGVSLLERAVGVLVPNVKGFLVATAIRCDEWSTASSSPDRALADSSARAML